MASFPAFTVTQPANISSRDDEPDHKTDAQCLAERRAASVGRVLHRGRRLARHPTSRRDAWLSPPELRCDRVYCGQHKAFILIGPVIASLHTAVISCCWAHPTRMTRPIIARYFISVSAAFVPGQVGGLHGGNRWTSAARRPLGQLVRIERQSDFRHPLQASTRPTVTAMYGAAVCRKRLSFDLSACGLASKYPASLTGAVAICVGILRLCRGLRDGVRIGLDAALPRVGGYSALNTPCLWAVGRCFGSRIRASGRGPRSRMALTPAISERRKAATQRFRQIKQQRARAPGITDKSVSGS
jgi:hypothetical protein